MKSPVVCLIAFLSFFQFATAQVIKDKNAFAKTFIAIFSQRDNGFDSLRVDQDEKFEETKLKLPGANECFISDNDIYGAVYLFPDSLKALAFYKELKGLLKHTASFYKSSVRFRKMMPEEDFYEIIYFSDSLFLTNEGSTISLSGITNDDEEVEDEEEEDSESKPARKPSKPFEVRLLLNPGNSGCYFTNAGIKINDPDLTNLIRVIAFGKDTALKNIRINPRIEKDRTLFGSKLGLKDFETEITEIRTEKKTGINAKISRQYFMSKESFLQQVEKMIFKLKSALPAGYCYELFYNEQVVSVEFKLNPFVPASGKEAEIKLQYSAAEGKQDVYGITLHIFRVIANKKRP